MAKKRVTCQTVTVHVTEADDHEGVTLVVPAYTRRPTDMQVTLEGLVAEYLERSRREGEPSSLGDFALYALSQASQEPRTQSA